MMSLHQLPKSWKRLAPLLAAPAALLLSQGQAKAVLSINIFDDGPNLKVLVQGSLSQIPQGMSQTSCGNNYLVGEFHFSSVNSSICSGGTNVIITYPIASATTGFGGTGALIADSFSGSSFRFASSAGDILANEIGLEKPPGLFAQYVPGTPIFSSATFNGKSLASQGFTARGLVGTWNLVGTSETINVCIGSDPCSPASSSVPGPMPLLGAGAAFGWSRRLRKRIAAPLITPPQA